MAVRPASRAEARAEACEPFHPQGFVPGVRLGLHYVYQKQHLLRSLRVGKHLVGDQPALEKMAAMERLAGANLEAELLEAERPAEGPSGGELQHPCG